MKFAVQHLNLVLMMLACCISAQAQSEPPVVEKVSEKILEKAVYLNGDYLAFIPEELKPDQKIPLLIYLHGSGGTGDNIQNIKRQPMALLDGIHRFKKGPCLVIAPQCKHESDKSKQRSIWVPEDLELLLQHLKASHPEIDTDRIYLSGISMGGYGSWVWGAHHPEHFAAIAPIVGGIGRGGPKDVTPDIEKWAINLAKVPVYAFAGALDRVVPAERSERMVAAIRKAGGTRARIKVYPEEGHGAGSVVFSSAEFFDWMFAQKRGK